MTGSPWDMAMGVWQHAHRADARGLAHRTGNQRAARTFAHAERASSGEYLARRGQPNDYACIDHQTRHGTDWSRTMSENERLASDLLNSSDEEKLAWARQHGGTHYADDVLRASPELTKAMKPIWPRIPQADLLKRARKCVDEWPTRRPEYADDIVTWMLNLNTGDLDGYHIDGSLEDEFPADGLRDYQYFIDVCVAQKGVIYADRLPVKALCEAMRADLARRTAGEQP